ncbi:MAG: tRNA (adenosine(37)-N6)-dimethylallyltransferase MiaA [Deltaproteobacteria bacterium]|nr:tRNA (adenosine(37)-N6)-dimethylallyltransferase MiaA [Deltaproteobacteria bacterium]
MIPSLIIIAGPTGIGKTETVLKLAEPLGAEVINADSMQVYKRMDIGTAKPTPEEQARVRHHMIDVVEPDEPFNAAQFREMAEPIIHGLHSAGKPVFVAGGTGLYIKVLTQGVFPCPEGSEEIRQELKADADALGSEALFNRLQAVDPESAASIHPNDTYRIVRALEVFELTGRPFSEHHNAHRFKDIPYRTLKIALTMDRAILYERIEQRVDRMLKQGLLDEVQGLLDDGFSPDLESMQSIGYSHAVKLLRGELSFDEMVRTLKRDTRRYAKRQFTWFKADPGMTWLEPGETDHMRKMVDVFLESFRSS